MKKRNRTEEIEQEQITFRIAKDDAEISRINKKMLDRKPYVIRTNTDWY